MLVSWRYYSRYRYKWYHLKSSLIIYFNIFKHSRWAYTKSSIYISHENPEFYDCYKENLLNSSSNISKHFFRLHRHLRLALFVNMPLASFYYPENYGNIVRIYQSDDKVRNDIHWQYEVAQCAEDEPLHLQRRRGLRRSIIEGQSLIGDSSIFHRQLFAGRI